MTDNEAGTPPEPARAESATTSQAAQTAARFTRESWLGLVLILGLLFATYCFNVFRLKREIELHRQNAPGHEGRQAVAP